MASWLLFSDTHFTDNPIEEYRWDIWAKIRELCVSNKISTLVHLGDLSDRKDRHSSNFLNRLADELASFSSLGVSVYIILGNHDEPIAGTPYWKVLSHIPGVEYVTSPRELADGKVLLLPFSKNPLEEWKDLNLASRKALFMHQTIAGVEVERGHVIDKTPNPMPIIPRGVAAFSGDIHRPQKVSGIQYIGTPYPVRMGEDWPGQVAIIQNDDFLNPKILVLPSIRRAILTVSSIKDLPVDGSFKSGDQVRIRYQLRSDEVSSWGTAERECYSWAERTGCSLLSCEATLVEVKQDSQGVSEQLASLEILPPSEIVQMFVKENKLSDETAQVGLDLLKSAQ